MKNLTNKLLKKIIDFELVNSKDLSIFNRIIENLLPDIQFLQIGANDGKSFDPIHNYVKKHKLKGTLVEPVDIYFNDLRKTYKEHQNNLRFINMAVVPDEYSDGEIELYRYRNATTDWRRGIASTNKQHLLNAGLIESEIVKVRAKSIGINKLIEEEFNGSAKKKVLITDCEGYDLILLNNINELYLNNFSLIHFEHNLFGTSKSEENQQEFLKFINKMISRGYLMNIDYTDCTVFKYH